MKKNTTTPVKTFISLEDARRQADTPNNQRIKGKLIEREVYCCMTGIIEYVLQKSEGDRDGIFTSDDIENFYGYDDIEYVDENGDTCYFCGSQAEKEQLIADLESFISDLQDNEELEMQIKKGIETLEDAEDTPNEIYEWWAVSNYLHGKLKEKGCPVMDNGFNYFWGRTTTGQAILLDSVISDIAAEMEILEGQPNEWKA